MVLAMLRGLPEDTTFAAHMKVEQDRERKADDGPSPLDIDPELANLIDKKTWTEDRKLLADISNRLGTILLHLHNWEKGKEPRLPIVGPQEWRDEAEPEQKKPRTIDDVFSMLTRSN